MSCLSSFIFWSCWCIVLVEKEYVYGPGTKKFVTQVIYRLYSGGSVVRTITDAITLNNSGNGPFEQSRTRTIT
jgi:hypothetical protein